MSGFGTAVQAFVIEVFEGVVVVKGDHRGEAVRLLLV